VIVSLHGAGDGQKSDGAFLTAEAHGASQWKMARHRGDTIFVPSAIFLRESRHAKNPHSAFMVFYALHVAKHVKNGDILIIDNYEFIYLVAARWTRLFRRVSFVLEYEDGKHLIERDYMAR